VKGRRWRHQRRPIAPRVLIVVQNLSVPFDRRVWLEAQALVAAGYGVSVICPQGEGEASEETLQGVRIRRYRAPRPVRRGAGYAYEFAYCWLRTAALTVDVLRREGFDVLQACNPPDTYFALAFLLRPLGKRFVYDQHDLCPELYEAKFDRDSGQVYRVLRLLERATYRTADHVISTNESYRRIAIERGHVPADQVTPVRNGPDLERLYPEPPQPELRQGRRYLCCYLGVMGPQDGVETVLRAADTIVHDLGRTDIHFALLGFGDCLEELRVLSTRLGLDDFVTFTGRANDTTIRAYLSTADVGLSPDPMTPFNQLSTMNKTMEYMAFGLPVLAFDLHETRVSAGPAAVYVPTDDPSSYAKTLCDLLDDRDQRLPMGRVARHRVVQQLAWPHQRPRYVAIYDRLIGRASADANYGQAGGPTLITSGSAPDYRRGLADADYGQASA
jgi:glycosyltransferase involved in cell wall biosynthesis